MDVVAAKQIGAGLATIAFVGSGIGIGVVFGNYISGALRNPGAACRSSPISTSATRFANCRACSVC